MMTVTTGSTTLEETVITITTTTATMDSGVIRRSAAERTRE